MMNPGPEWPCPVCAALLPAGAEDCPSCRLPGPWVDLILALDHSIRHFHYVSLTGEITKEQFRQLVEGCRRRHDELAQAAQRGQGVPEDTGLTPRSHCWSCGHANQSSVRFCARCSAVSDRPEVRLFRYKTFLGREIQGHERAGGLTTNQARRLLAQNEETLADLRARLQGAAPVR